MDYNKYNDKFNEFNKKVQDNKIGLTNRDIEKDKSNLREYIKNVKTVDHHEHFMEFKDNRTGKKIGVNAIFRGVKYRETSISGINARSILDAAIESYFMTRPLGKVNVKDFIRFVNRNSDIYKIEIEYIDAIDLQVTQTLSQEIETKEPIEIENFKKKPIIEVPQINIPELNPKTPEEMPTRYPNEMPTSYPNEMPNVKGPKVREQKHVPSEEEITMGLE